MFISNDEKIQIRISIRTLTAQVDHLFEEIKGLKAKGPVDAVKVVKARKAYRPPPLIKTAEAPWGQKKYGSPRKRPGRPPFTQPTVNNEQPLFN